MRRLLILVLSVMGAAAILAACGENPVDPEAQAAVRDFPNYRGYVWDYEYVDSVTLEVDTISVLIQDEITLPNGGRAREWYHMFAHKRCGDERCSYRLNVQVEGRSALFYLHSEATTAIQLIEFPLVVGAKWKEPIPAESTLVAAQEVLTVPAGTFNNAFRIQCTYFDFFEGGRAETIWIVPGIGIVQRHIHTFGFIETSSSWRLIKLSTPKE